MGRDTPVPSPWGGGLSQTGRPKEATGDWCPSRSSKPVGRGDPPGGFDSRPPPLRTTKPDVRVSHGTFHQVAGHVGGFFSPRVRVGVSAESELEDPHRI